MPKPIKQPFIIDTAKTITIADLKRFDYLKPHNQKNGSIKWSENGIETSSCSVNVLINENSGILFLNYKCNGKKYFYEVQIISKVSNLGKGKLFYFICPFTLKVCRKLHLYNGRFIHSSAISNGMYSKQIHTKKWREMERIYGNYFDKDKYYDILHSKHFKKFYNGKPTKRYLMLMDKINDANTFSANDIERLFLLGM
tara:strand:- start:145 stop:738 length:594 start_codon:yes stop_codon:yes gene_type:complete